MIYYLKETVICQQNNEKASISLKAIDKVQFAEKMERLSREVLGDIEKVHVQSKPQVLQTVKL